MLIPIRLLCWQIRIFWTPTAIELIGWWTNCTSRRWNSIFLIIHWEVLLASILNSRLLFMLWLNYLLNSSRKWSLRRSFHFLINEFVHILLIVLILHQTIWSALLKRLHWLYLGLFISWSLTIHLCFWPLNDLVLTDIMACNLRMFSWSLQFFRLVIYRILVFNVIIWSS